MDHSKKLDFIHKMAKLGLQHFDAGGAVSNGLGQAEDNSGTVGQVLTPPSTTQSGTPGTQNPYVQSNATNPNVGIIGSIGGALGLNDNFQASSANITPGTNTQQLSDAYTGAQNALTAQQNLQSTLAPQAATAVSNQNALAAQLQQQANGQGPNVARNQLNQATSANTANQAALMAGQRGSSSNVGLMARQNAMTGAANQQSSAGQAATLGSQQQIAAQQNLANLSNAQISQTGQATTGLSSATQGEQGILQNANTAFNNSAVGMQSNINNVNSQTAAANQNQATNIMGGVMQGASSVMSMLADGGDVDQEPTNLGSFTPAAASGDSGPSIPGTSTLPANTTNLGQSASGGSGGGGGGGGGGIMSLAALMASGGNVAQGPHQSHVANYLWGDSSPKNMLSGGNVKADSKNQKAVKPGNSYANDKIPAMLSEGEVVIDRDTLADKGPIGQMARALQAHIAQRNGKKK